MESLFHRLTNFKGGDSDFKEYIEDLNLSFFFNMYAVYPTVERARKAIMFIVWTYSRESDFVLAGEAWGLCKERVALKVSLDEEMVNELVKFEFKYVEKKTEKQKEEEDDDGTGELEANEYNVTKIVKCINDYLEYQDDKINKHLKRMHDLYEQFSSASVAMITKGKSGVIDWDQKALCQKEANRLYDEIETWEQKLTNQSSASRTAIEELKSVRKKVTSLRPEVV